MGSIDGDFAVVARKLATVELLVGWMLCVIVATQPSCRRSPSEPAPEETGATGGASTAWFEEVAAAVGVDFVHRSGHDDRYLFPEIMAGGVGMLDYDADGFLDLYFVQAGSLDPSPRASKGNKLYRNRGDGTFEDVTASAAVGDRRYGMGCACGDYNADGYPDIYVTNVGRNTLYRNNADGTFTDVTETARVGDASWSSSAAFFDYDRDGWLDLIVVNYVNWSLEQEQECFSRGGLGDYCHPSVYRAPARDTLYRNRGDGTFEVVTTPTGIDHAFGTGLGVTCGDLNGDGHTDLYIANDGMPNQLWINTGTGRFTDQALLAGCAVSQHGIAEAGMGVTTVDHNNDGDLDLFLSHLRDETNTFYDNSGGTFTDVTAGLGLAAPSVRYTGFGLGFADFDHDGNLDLYVANGRVMLADPRHDAKDPYAELNLLMIGNAGGGFGESVPSGGTQMLLIATSRGAALGDLDNDGDIDVVVVNKDARPYVLRNIAGTRGNWIMFRVLDRNGSDAIGAAVRIDDGHRTQRRIVQSNYGYCSSHDPRIHFGLGSATRVTKVAVRWPDGNEESYGEFVAGEMHEIRQRPE